MHRTVCLVHLPCARLATSSVARSFIVTKGINGPVGIELFLKVVATCAPSFRDNPIVHSRQPSQSYAGVGRKIDLLYVKALSPR